MSLPRKEIAIEYLKLYEQLRQKDQKPKTADSFLNKASETLVNTTKFLLGQPSDQTIRDTIKTFIRQIQELNTFEDYIRLIHDLGEAAYKAQCQKIALFKAINFTEESSLLGTFLHAIRSYLVSHLGHETSHFYRDLSNYRNRISKECSDLDKEIAMKRYTLQTDVTDLVKARNERLTRLAYLEDPAAINILIDKKLLPLLPRYLGKSHNMITSLQKDHYLTFYDSFVRDTTRISFKEFCDQAIEKHNPQRPPDATNANTTFANAEADQDETYDDDDDTNDNTDEFVPNTSYPHPGGP